ncbi:MAG: glycosyltransferase [Phycisphaeraceae bacterium]|nr:glycosyltransferase [Phycisphaeraceae bacterium]MCW5754689.1 glycosyltransferase [Phycisphaeraceae bacterium]
MIPGAPPQPSRLLRIDAHCHSRASDGPALAALGFVGCPESYSPPEKVYDQALARGMDFVTLTDHDTIQGGLELLHRGFQNFILGEEVTVYFPEDRCKLHVLVWGLTPDQHEQIAELRLRDDVYAFAYWLREQQLPHALAHPLYIQNARFDTWHLERCALLFKGFETLNGAHSGLQQTTLERFFAALTPGRLLDIAKKHALEPLWERAWQKARTAGSDDHALLNVGRTWTALDAEHSTTDPRDFFRQVMKGRSTVGGVGGHPALLAHQLTSVGAAWYARTSRKPRSARRRFARARLLRFAGVRETPPGPFALAWDTLRRTIRPRSRLPLWTNLRRSLDSVLDRYPSLRERLHPDSWVDGPPLAQHDTMEQFFIDLTHAVAELLQDGTLKAVRAKDRRGVLDHVLSYACLTAAQAPYLFSLFQQNKERPFLDKLDHQYARSGSGISITERPTRLALFTDTLGDVNGVSRFIRTMGEHAFAAGKCLHIATSTAVRCPDAPYIHNFRPLFSMRMPGYSHLEVALPPLLDMLRWADQVRPDVIHVSTPGPVGLVGILAARMLKCPLVGTYHTDFPAFVEDLLNDHVMTRITEKCMTGFYKRFAGVLTRSREYVPRVSALGIDPDRITPLTPGCDTIAFHRKHADRAMWRTHALLPETLKILYCGRVSVEKNLPLLTAIWPRVREALYEQNIHADLVIIGDGPYREEMQKQLKNHGACFLGYRFGHELSTLYASADLFVFPSLTDTLGQAVMEAQASGLPALVSDCGGPREVIQNGRTGLVLPGHGPQAWVEAIVHLAADSTRRAEMSHAAFDLMQSRSFAHSFEHFWKLHDAVRARHLASMGITAGTSPRPAAPEHTITSRTAATDHAAAH